MNKKIAIGINGAKGKMGKTLRKAILKDSETFLKYAYDIKLEDTNVKDLCNESEVVIDFSSDKGCQELLEAALYSNTRLVICSTGLSNQQIQKLENAALKIPVLYSANTSTGASLMTKLCQIASKVLTSKEFDIAILDIHHKNKQDSPSGTALSLEKAICQEYCNQQSPMPNLHLTSIRGGLIVGEHRVMYLGNQEEITISHKVTDRMPFAKVALKAAKWLMTQTSGKLYTMQDIL